MADPAATRWRASRRWPTGCATWSNALGVREASLVGHSLGSLAALECAARYPERVRRLALLGPSVPMPVSDDLLAAAARNDHVAYELINGWSFAAGSQLGGNQVPGMWMTGNALRLMERSRDGVLSNDLVACNRYAHGLDAAARVRCPTLVIVGARDIMAPPRNAKALIAALPDVRTVTLPETGHSLMAERPDAVLDALRGFLAPTPPPLDRAADRMILIDRRAAGASDLRHRLEQLASRRRIRRASRRIEPSAVRECQIAIEAEELRRAHGVVGARDVLRFVDDVRESESVLRRERLHVVERVFRVHRRIVAHDRDAADAERRELVGVADDLRRDGAHVRTMIGRGT